MLKNLKGILNSYNEDELKDMSLWINADTEVECILVEKNSIVLVTEEAEIKINDVVEKEGAGINVELVQEVTEISARKFIKIIELFNKIASKELPDGAKFLYRGEKVQYDAYSKGMKALQVCGSSYDGFHIYFTSRFKDFDLNDEIEIVD